jgi:hypothetical protein
MASGHLSLRLSENVRWEEFPTFAEELLGLIQATVLKRTDGVEMRIWDVRIDGHLLRLVYEDFPVCASLESPSVEGDVILQTIRDRLLVECRAH